MRRLRDCELSSRGGIGQFTSDSFQPQIRVVPGVSIRMEPGLVEPSLVHQAQDIVSATGNGASSVSQPTGTTLEYDMETAGL